MAALLLVLSVLPCADGTYEIKDSNVQSSIAIHQDQQNDQEHKDTCTPFCHCTCCAGTSINHFFASTSSLMIFEDVNYSTYLPINLFDFSPPVWQPPQIA